jgi:hypothetical protein
MRPRISYQIALAAKEAVAQVGEIPRDLHAKAGDIDEEKRRNTSPIP